MRIDPRRLLDLLAVARHGTISSAAEALNVSQPGLSQSIAQLEHGLKAKVLERDRHGARLTEVGRALVLQAKALEALLACAKEETRLRSQGIEGPLAVGLTPISAVSLVPKALKLLFAETPKVAVSLVEGLDDELLAMLRARELDLVVSRLPPGVEGLEAEPLTLSDWALITHPKHALARRASVTLDEVPASVRTTTQFSGSHGRPGKIGCCQYAWASMAVPGQRPYGSHHSTMNSHVATAARSPTR